MDLFAELKRRNVFRVAIAYLALAWVVIQITDLAVPALNLPASLNSIVFYIGVIGFPFACLFAWAYELTPEGVMKTEDVDASLSVTHSTGRKLDFVIIGLLAVALGYFLWERQAGVAPAEDAVVSEAPKPARPDLSIAVLPFANMSSDPEQDYFSDGLSEELLNLLVKLPGLKVAGRTSSFAYKGVTKDLRTIGHELGVSHLLEGSVRKQQDRVRITAQLIRTDDGFHIWSESYDRNLADIFAVQDEIATAIAKALTIQLEIGEAQSLVRSRTDNMAAYDKYLEARILLSRRENFGRILALLDEVTTMDPDFAPAWGVLAQTHALSRYYYDSGKAEALANTLRAADRALALDPELATAHSARADALRDDYRWLEAETNYKRALAIDPDLIEANSQYAQMLARLGLARRALAPARNAAELDPMSWVNQLVYGLLLHQLGEGEKGWRHMDQSLAIAPKDNIFLAATRLDMMLDDGDTAAALRELERVKGLTEHSTRLGSEALYQSLIDGLKAGPGAPLAWLRGNYRQHPLQDTIMISVATYLGDTALAEEMMIWFWGTGNSGTRSTGILDMIGVWHPFLTPLRQADGFPDAARTINMDRYWRIHGWPDACRPLDGDDFACD